MVINRLSVLWYGVYYGVNVSCSYCFYCIVPTLATESIFHEKVELLSQKKVGCSGTAQLTNDSLTLAKFLHNFARAILQPWDL